MAKKEAAVEATAIAEAAVEAEATATETVTSQTAELESAVNKIKELEEKLAKLEAENAEAEKVTESVTNSEEVEEPRVRIKLFKDSKDYKDDLTVGVNGKIYQIRRGVEVDIPQSVYEVISNSITQDEHTAELIDSLVESTLNTEKENGI